MICDYPKTWLTFHTGVIYIALPSPCMPPSVHTESDHSVHTQTAFCQVFTFVIFLRQTLTFNIDAESRPLYGFPIATRFIHFPLYKEDYI